MKTKKYILCSMLVALTGFLASCEDWFDIHPKSETIFEDFWQDESDVLSVLGSCYRSMNEPGFVERCIVWGELRSDNVLKGAAPSDDILRILNINLNASNGYTYWGEFYRTINYCNTVIKFAPGVQAKDPNFKLEDLQTYIAEAKGVRALCYFWLVRTFKDVPLITEPYADDRQAFEKVQTPAADLLDYLINDLKEVEGWAADEKKWTNVTYRKGRITRNAIRTLIADMYLWKNDYQNCITYCDKVLSNAGTLQLESSQTYNYNTFVFGNSKESIFELQFSDANNVMNYPLFEMYSFYGGGRGDKNSFQLSSLNFSKLTKPLFGTTDLRGKDAYFVNGSGAHSYITKYITMRYENTSGTVRESDYVSTMGAPNWIFYRLSDVYLMKAEALAELDKDLAEALALVSKTYDRANPDLGSGTLQLSDYNSQAAMRELVFSEKQREFLFEGKRYFDLLRRINREGKTSTMVNAYLLNKYEALDGTTVKSKLSDINAFYMPINADELRSNTLLKQNPFYVSSSNIE